VPPINVFFLLPKSCQVVSSKKVVLHSLVKSKGLTLFDSSYSELSNLRLAIISIALMDSIIDEVKPCHQRLSHFDFTFLHVES